MKMERERQSELEAYAELFEQARNRVNDAIVAGIIVQELGKDRRVERMRAERQADRAGASQAASIKQLEFLRDLGVKIANPRMTRQEASQLLEEALAKRAAQ